VRAALDEPIFILRAQDMLAPRVVVRWAHLAEQAGTPQDKARRLKLGKQMADWQAKGAGLTVASLRFARFIGAT
jgi:hypothetical protein